MQSATVSDDMQDSINANNQSKYLSYKEAWHRIKIAQDKSFYFEAVTLEESIIADRLISYLIMVGSIQRSHRYPSLGQLIQHWETKHPNPIEIKECKNLRESVDEWRRNRNDVVHGIVKSYPGEQPENIDNFLLKAELSAQVGASLARHVSLWVRQQRRSFQKKSEVV